MIANSQRLLLDQLFLKLFDNIKRVREQEVAINKFKFVKILTDDAAIANDVDKAIVSVRHHEDKYDRPFMIEEARQVQPAPIKAAVFDVVAEFCTKTGTADEQGYELFKEYFAEIPYLNGQYGPRNILGKIEQLLGRSPSQ